MKNTGQSKNRKLFVFLLLILNLVKLTVSCSQFSSFIDPQDSHMDYVFLMRTEKMSYDFVSKLLITGAIIACFSNSCFRNSTLPRNDGNNLISVFADIANQTFTYQPNHLLLSHKYQPWNHFLFLLVEEWCVDVTIKNIADRFPKTLLNFSSRIFITFESKKLDPTAPGVVQFHEIYYIKDMFVVEMVKPIHKQPSSYILLQHVARRHNFRQQSIIGSVAEEPYASSGPLIEVINGTAKFKKHTSTDLYHDMRDSLNFSESAVQGDRIAFNSKGNLMGVTLEQFQNETADISLTQQTAVAYRARRVTFLHAITLANAYAFFEQPAVSSIRNIMVTPFDPLLWLIILISWFLIVITLKINLVLKQYLMIAMTEEELELLAQVEIWGIQTCCQQGWHHTPSSLSIQTIFVTSSLLGLFVYVAYSASFYSRLSTEKPPMQSFQDILNNQFTLAYHKNSGTMRIVVQGMHPKRRSISVKTEDEVTILLTGRPIAFLSFAEMFYGTAKYQGFNEIFICQAIASVRVNNVPFKSGMFTSKGSQFKEIFNHRTLQYIETGRRDRSSRIYTFNTEVFCHEENSVFLKPIGYTDIFTAFVIGCSGLFFSILFLAMEIAHHFLRTKKLLREKCSPLSRKI